jgi:hypothetical protein
MYEFTVHLHRVDISDMCRRLKETDQLTVQPIRKKEAVWITVEVLNDHATPLYAQKLALTSPSSCG